MSYVVKTSGRDATQWVTPLPTVDRDEARARRIRSYATAILIEAEAPTASADTILFAALVLAELETLVLAI